MVRASEQAALAPPRAATSPTPSPFARYTLDTCRARHELPSERSSAREIVTISCIVSRRPSLSVFLLLRFSHRYSIRYLDAPPAVWSTLQRVLESCTRRRRTRASRLIYAGQRARTKATSSFAFDETVGVASSSHHGMRRQQRATVNSRSIL